MPPAGSAQSGQGRASAAGTITMFDDPAAADVVLDVSYTFAWDYPFSVNCGTTRLDQGSRPRRERSMSM
jgi:hypothetical protein